jgi:hypothetical protein
MVHLCLVVVEEVILVEMVVVVLDQEIVVTVDHIT